MAGKQRKTDRYMRKGEVSRPDAPNAGLLFL